jgi:hypothetical protein
MGLSLPRIRGLAALSLTPQRPPISAPVLYIYREKSARGPRRRVIIPWNLRVLRSIFCFLSSLYSALAFFFNFNISIARFRFL